MAISSYGVYLMHKVEDAYTKLIDIKDFPDLGGAAEMLETTTLSDSMQTYIEGIQSSDALEFTANYTLDEYKMLQGMKGTEHEFAVYFGTDNNGTITATNGSFLFSGFLSVRVNGAGVNEVIGMTVSITPSSPITSPTAA